MNRTDKCILLVFTAVVICLFSLLASATVVNARISEPHHTLYGLLPEKNTTITLKIDGETVSTYTRGENPTAGDYFVLRVPLDSLDPPLPGTYRSGVVAGLYLDTEIWPEKEVFVGGRGTVQLANLDEFPPEPYYDDNTDVSPKDDIVTEDSTDTDGDGYTDIVEADNLNSGILDPDGYAFDPFVANAPGGVGYSESPKIPAGVLLLLLNDH